MISTIGGNGADNYLRHGVVVDLHKTNNFAPNEFRGVVDGGEVNRFSWVAFPVNRANPHKSRGSIVAFR